MSISEPVLRDSVEGKMGLTRGQWVKFGRVLGLPTTYSTRPSRLRAVSFSMEHSSSLGQNTRRKNSTHPRH